MGYDSVPAAKGSKKRASTAAEEYESDGGFVANDNDNDDAPKLKKVKTKSAKAAAKGRNASPVKKDDGETEFFELSGKRRVTIDNFKGNTMVNIREYYEDKSSGNMLPGKKGISLPIAQFQTLVTLLPEIEGALIAKGESVPRPDYSGSKAAAADNGDNEEEQDEAEEEKVVKKKGKDKKSNGKKNFEATSDEEE